MAKLYLSSSLIPNQKFLSFEELFGFVNPSDILLVFDTNIVIHYREFYLNPVKFIDNHKEDDVYHILRYLIEQIDRYDLEVNASIGVEESSRSKENFSLDFEKARQTNEAILNLFSMNLDALDKHINEAKVIDPIYIKSQSTNSKLTSLKQTSIFQNILTISYLSCLKIHSLQTEIELNLISPREAYKNFYKFITLEVNAVGGTSILFTLHLFGGVNEFKSMIFSKKNKSTEEKIHQIFNGAIDLIYPYIVNKAQDLFPIKYSNKKLIPVLITMDKRLASLHSFLNTKLIFESEENEVNYNPELVEVGYYERMSWSKDDFQFFKELHIEDIETRLKSNSSGGKTAEHLLPLVDKYEKIIRDEI